MGTKRDVDSIELSEPVPSSSRGIYDIVVAHVHDTFQVLVEEQPEVCSRGAQHMRERVSMRCWAELQHINGVHCQV